jgi:hypothetical protein
LPRPPLRCGRCNEGVEEWFRRGRVAGRSLTSRLSRQSTPDGRAQLRERVSIEHALAHIPLSKDPVPASRVGPVPEHHASWAADQCRVAAGMTDTVPVKQDCGPTSMTISRLVVCHRRKPAQVRSAVPGRYTCHGTRIHYGQSLWGLSAQAWLGKPHPTVVCQLI